MNWGAHKADVRIAAKNSVTMRAALRASINAKAIYEAYQETHPFVTENNAQDRARARAWAMLHVKIDNEPIKAALTKIYAEGFLLGLDASKEAIQSAEKTRNKTVTKSDDYVDWANWKPGNRAAALLYRPTGAFEKILSNAGIVSKKIAEAGYDRIGTALSDSIAAGFSPGRAAKVITEKIGDPARALTIAITEQNRAMSMASLQNYQTYGVEKVEWSGANPCDICAPNEGQVVNTGEAFNSGDTQPPVHPNCRCALLPVIDDSLNAEPSDEINLIPSNMEAGTPSLISRAEYEKARAEFESILPANAHLEDTLKQRGYQAEIDYERLLNTLTQKYKDAGMGATNAKMQARIDIGRVYYYMDNEAAKQRWYATRDSLIEQGYQNDATQMEKGLEKATSAVNEAMRSGKITIALTEDNLLQVLQDGKWKNQFETKTSGGALDPSIRKWGEGVSQKLPADTAPKTRPIYGYLTTNTAPDSGYSLADKTFTQQWSDILSINSRQVSQYGEIRVILNDTLRENTTITIGDSLRTGVLADKLTAANPDLSQMGLYEKGAPSHMNGAPIAAYIEAQITGGVTTKDIAAVYAPSDAIQRVTQMLQQAGINVPVYPMGGTP